VGKAEEVLGTIPKPSELRSQMRAIDKETEMDTIESERIAKIASKSPIFKPEEKRKKIPKLK
jgi:hypothetical protein